MREREEAARMFFKLDIVRIRLSAYPEEAIPYFFMRNIFIYTGKGAYQARDIENVLAVFDFDYQRVCEHDLSSMSPDGIFIVPGGAIREYLPAWGKDGKEKIRAFVKDGGTYIGICAGSYVAGSSFDGHEGLGFFDGELVHTKYQRLVDARDVQGNGASLLAENGPDISTIKGDVLLKSIEGETQAICFSYGNGQVYLFASHPEGSVYERQYPQEFSGAKWFSKFLSRL